MYHEHFGLERAPFRITPDTELFYPGGGRGEVLEALVYAVTSGEGIVKVTGEVGTGKTMLCRMLEVRLPGSVEVVYIANPSLSPEDILHAIALEMNLPVEAAAGRLQVMHALQHRLLEMHANNRRVVVFVEEAQSMPTATLEEIRLLSNLETQRDKLLQIVLFGQPELDESLDRSNIRQLRERITHSFRLEPLSRDEVREYVRFRMRAVGYRGPDVFTESACRRLARASEGLVRRINILADKALLAAFAEDTHNVTRRHMRVAIDDGSFGRRPAHRVRWLGGIAAVLLAAVGTLFALDHLPWQQWLQHYREGLATLAQPAATAPVPVEQTGQSPAPAGAMASPAQVPQQVPAPAPGPASARVPDPPPSPAPGPSAAVAAVSALDAEAAAERATPTESVALSGDVGPIEGTETLPASLTRGEVAGASTPIVAEAAPAAPAAPAEPVMEAVVVAAAPPPVQSTVTAATSAADAAVSAAPPAPEPEPARTDAAPEPPAVAEPSAPEPVAAPSTQAGGTGDEPSTEVVRYAAPALDSVKRGNHLIAERAQATAEWLRTPPRGGFCIQLLLADKGRQQSLEEFLARVKQLGIYEQIFIYETVISARGWFGVIYGEFDTFEKSRAALEALPEDLKRHKPFIRNVRDIVGQG